MCLFKLNTPMPALMVAYALALSAGAAANVWINYVAKGSTWDLYPVAESLWVLCSVVVVAMCGSMRRLVFAVIALLLLDSFVDLCAMGHHSWWAGPPLLIEWKWQSLREDRLLYIFLYAYWACTWGLQVPLRCIAMARAVSGGWGRQFLAIALGLNLIWFTSPQDIPFYFVWWGIYDAHFPYFSHLPPEGVWNLWNMLLLRVPIGVAVGALLIWAGGKYKGKVA